MFNFEEEYYKITKLGLQWSGLWIYQKVYQRVVGLLAWFIVNWIMVLSLVVMLLKEYKDMNILIENTLMTLFFIGMCIKVINAFLNLKKMKALYVNISLDWQKITNYSEREILKRYSNQGRRLAKFYSIYAFSVGIVCSSRPFVPLLMNIISPLENGTRPPTMPYYSDYIFFDQADYLYWVWAYLFLTHIFVLLPSISGVDSFYMLTVSHTCGLFAVIRHRIKTATDIPDKDERSHKLRRNFEIDKNLKQAVKLHQTTIRSFQLLEDSFSNCFLIIMVLCIGGLGLAGTYTLFILDDGYQLLRCVVIIFGIVMHLLIINWVGQQLIDSSEHVFYSAYFSEWYSMSPTTRKYIFIIMVRSYYPCALTAGKLMNVSLEVFGMIMRNAVSYFTVFSSLT